jgi:undecaprenyl-diphosphatase
MDPVTLGMAVLLGVVEGLTEFLPVSSTGHLILLVDLLGFKGPPGKVFEVAIQLGAILAIVWVYRVKFLEVARGVLRLDEPSLQFAYNLFVAFVPAMVLGALLHGFIKSVLFSPWVVSAALIAGAGAIVAVERWKPAPRHETVDTFRPWLAFRIGLFQTVAMVPGVSRSGATIMGGMLLGADRRAATEFSFFLAVPTMLAATVYDVYKNRAALGDGDWLVIAVGFASAFVAAMLVVRWLVGFVGRHGFVPFAVYRAIVGAAMLAILALGKA